jgi:uncharacterized membrane protein
MKKVIGYLVSIIGLALIAFIVKPLNELEFVKSLTSSLGIYATIILIAAGVVLIILGVFILRSSSKGKQPAEVPIYQGKDVVGFRRMGKK